MKIIKHYRRIFGLTQTELAKKLGVSLCTVYRWEAGEREPRSSELMKMATLFGCTVENLINPTLPSANSTPPGTRARKRRKAVTEAASA